MIPSVAKPNLSLLFASLAFIMVGLLTLVVASLFFVGGYWRNYINGPTEVISKVSPDTTSKAFVLNSPSIDGPNHSLNIESADKSTLMLVAHLEEDVDFIKDIIWSEDSQYVLFWSKDYLTLVNVDSFNSKRIYLSSPAHRVEKSGKSRFIPQPAREIESVGFLENTLEYTYRQDQSSHQVTLPE